MASSLKWFACLFVVSILSTQIHARESQFFSKVSATTTTAVPTTTTTTTVNNKDKEQDPSFIPETRNGYGLYGQESTQFPGRTRLAGTDDTYTDTSTANDPFSTRLTYTNNNNNANYYYSTNNDEFNNVNSYEDQQQNVRDKGYTTTTASENQNYNNNYYYNGGNGYNNVEKQGMSDTRFMENGKYFYDPNNEKGHYYTNDQYQNTKANYESTRGGFYSNNNEYNNNMERSENWVNFQNDKYDP